MTNGLVIKHKDLVIPGQILASGMDYLPGDHTYREGEAIYTKVLGLANLAGRVIKVTPLSGPYQPRIGDKIIGKVFDITMSGWRIRTNTAYAAMMNVKDASNRFIRRGEDLSKIINVGDSVVVKISNVTSQNLIDLSMRDPDLFKIQGGRIVEINAMKVPRVIGKQGSMVSLIKKYTACDITVGQNGLIFIKGKNPENEYLAERAVKMVEEKSHLSGLTEKMQAFLETESKGLDLTMPAREERSERPRFERRERRSDSGDKPAPRFERKPQEAAHEAPKTEEKSEAQSNEVASAESKTPASAREGGEE